MPFFVYGTDIKTGEVAARFVSHAATEAEAREQAELQGMRVGSVVPSRSTSAISLPERLPPEQTPEGIKAAEVEQVAVFNHTLEENTPHLYVSYGLIGINAFVFVLMSASGADIFNPDSAVLLRWGAEYGPNTTGGESWRLLSALFVHIGILHLAYNMIAFMYVAPTVERMLGNAGFLLTYLVAGIGGSLWALLYNPLQLHAGASGSIFGIYGALLALLLRDRNAIPAHVRSGLRTFVLVFIAYNLINSLRPGISMAAHIGGMATGFLCGLVLAQGFTLQARAGRVVRQTVLAVCGIALFIGGVQFVSARYPNLDRLVELLDRSFETMHQFKVARQKVSDKQLTDSAFATLIEHDLLPQWSGTRVALAGLTPVPSGLTTEIAVMLDYMHLRQQHWEALLTAEREANARKWLHPAKLTDEEMDQRSRIGAEYIHAEVNLDFSHVDASARDSLKRLQGLSMRVKELGEREHSEFMRLKFDDFSAFVEREMLPASHDILQAFAELPPLPAPLDQDAKAILKHVQHKHEEWQSRVDYVHYERDEKAAEQARSRADDAARAIRRTSGGRLSAPY